MTEPNLPLSSKDVRTLVQLGERYCGSQDPGPDRLGCPPDDVLRNLASQSPTASLSRSSVSHVVDCAECYPRYLALRRKAIWVATGQYTAVGLGVLAVAVFVVWMAFGPGFRPETPSISGPIATPRKGATVADNSGKPATSSESAVPAPTTPVSVPKVTRASLDLRSLSSQRSDSVANLPAPRVGVERGRAYISTILPIGSPPGTYEFAILGANGVPRHVFTSTAKVENGLTRFVARMDLTKQKTGNYKLGVRSKGGKDWLEATLTVR